MIKRNYFNKFLEINKKIIKKYPSKNSNIILTDRGRLKQLLYSLIFLSATQRKFLCNVMVISDSKYNKNFFQIYKSFGVESIFRVSNIILNLKNSILVLNSLFLFLFSLPIIKIRGFEWFTKKFSVSGIEIGDLVYDSYIKYGTKNFIRDLKNPKLDFKFCKLLFLSIFKTLFLVKISKKIKLIIVGTTNYANFNSLAARVGAYKNVRVIHPDVYSPKFTRKINNFIEYDLNKINYGRENIRFNKKKKEMFFQQTAKLTNNNLDTFIEKRFSGKIKLVRTKILDIKNANNSKKIISKNDLLKKLNINKDQIKKIVLIAPHAFTDAPHTVGKRIIFTDYYTHFKETLEYIDNSNIKKVVWVVRPHPKSKLFGEVGIVEEVVKKINNSNIVLCPENLNTRNLVKICDHVITCKGTIGLEFAIGGKFPITAGVAVYSGLGFSIDSKNKDEYFKNIKNIIKLKNIKKKQINIAKKALYFFEKSEIDYNYLANSNILSQDYSKNDLSFFNSKLIKRLKKYKSFEKDNLYKDIIKKI